MRLFLLILYILQFNQLFSQSETVLVDLAEFNGKSGTIEKPLDIKKIRKVLIENRFIKLQYNVVIKVEAQMLQPLPAFETLTTRMSTTECEALRKSYNDANSIARSKEPNANENELKKALEKLTEERRQSRCSDNELNKKIDKLIDSTKGSIDVNIDLKRREDLVIIITRGENVYKLILTSDDDSRWVINYGFAFTSRALEPKKYFIEGLGADSFKISKKKDYGILDLRFTPAIFFSYFLNKKLSKNFNHSLTGGVGFNTQTPVVFLGYNVMYNQNVGISFGLSFYEQQKLLGKYKENQILKEPLDEQQLYETLIFRPNFFLSFNFRFANNPFKTNNPAPATE